MENKNGTKWIYREEVKFWILVLGIIVSAIWNYFSLHEQVSLHSYKIEQIEKARAEIWQKQDEINRKQTEILTQIQKDMATIINQYKPR